MTLALRKTLRAGVAHVCTRNGLVLIVTFLVVLLLQSGFVWMVSTMYLPLGSGVPVVPTPNTGPTPGTSPPALVIGGSALLASIAGGFLTIPVRIVAIRTMVSRYTDRIPEEFVFHNMGWATLHSFLGSWLISILVIILALGCLLPVLFLLLNMMGPQTEMWILGHWLGWIGIGLLALILLLPSAFLGLSLLFVCHEISIKDKNLIDGITGSWQCCQGNRFRLLALVLLSFIFYMISSMIVFVGTPMLIELNDVLLQTVYIVEASIIQVIMITIMARAYAQIHDGDITIIADNATLSN
jgi:hypothetical protein